MQTLANCMKQKMIEKGASMFVHVSDVEPTQVNNLVSERLLLPKVKSKGGNVEAVHWTLRPGGKFTIPSVDRREGALYVISGRGLLQPRDEEATRGVTLYADMAFWFAKGAFVMSNKGEGEMRVLLVTTTVERDHYEFTRPRMQYFHSAPLRLQAGYVARAMFSTQEIATCGGLRTHAMEVETLSPNYEAALHVDPEEVLYLLRGEGEMETGGKREKIRPGTLVYSPDHIPHGMWNTSNIDNMEYMVIEFNELRKRFSPLISEIAE